MILISEIEEIINVEMSCKLQLNIDVYAVSNIDDYKREGEEVSTIMHFLMEISLMDS